MRYLLTKELFSCEENFSKIFSFLTLVAQKNFQIVYIEEGEEFEKFKEHFSKFVLSAILQKIQKDLKLFTSRQSNIFKISLKRVDGFITIDEAISLISKPFLVCMENNRNDKNFLNFFCDEDQKKLLKELEINNELAYWSGGGTGELKAKVASDNFCKLTSYVFFDSDQLPFDPATIERTPKDIKEICIHKNIRYSILKRRFIESYVPAKSLHNYVLRNKYNTRDYNPLFQEFSRLECNETKYFFNMKYGLNGDVSRAGGRDRLINSYFYKIPRDKIGYFNKGFGDRLSSVYEEQISLSEKMKDIDGWNEINGIVKNILRVI